MDFVAEVPHLPAPGETLSGRAFHTLPGGKGANQANAAGRLARPEHRVRMIGRVGVDSLGDQLKASLATSGVDVSGVMGTRGVPTGVALIWVEPGGQNSIVVIAGANGQVSSADVESMLRQFEGSAVALFQLETPLGAVEAGLRAARAAGARTILDPAPARLLEREILGQVDLLTPNETEACILLGLPPKRLDPAAAPDLAETLVTNLGVGAVVLKLGDAGCYYLGPEGQIQAPGFAVQAVDATAAGDTFNAALAVALTEGQPMQQALRFANAAAAISVTRLGAQASAPSRPEVEDFLRAHA